MSRITLEWDSAAVLEAHRKSKEPPITVRPPSPGRYTLVSRDRITERSSTNERP